MFEVMGDEMRWGRCYVWGRQGGGGEERGSDGEVEGRKNGRAYAAAAAATAAGAGAAGAASAVFAWCHGSGREVVVVCYVGRSVVMGIADDGIVDPGLW